MRRTTLELCKEEFFSTRRPDAPHADGIRRQGVVGPVGLGGRDAGRRGAAAVSGVPGERMAGLVEEVTFLWILPHIPWI